MSVCVEYPSVYLEDDNDSILGSPKLIDKINHRISGQDKFFSLEFFPPRTANGTYNLLEKCDRLSQGSPLFCDVTSDITRGESYRNRENCFLTLASTTQDVCGLDTMLQLNCTNIRVEQIMEVLSKAKVLGLRNILAMTEGPNSKEDEVSSCYEDFQCTAQVIRFIRKQFGNYFNICVAGYPSVVYEKFVPYEESIAHLKEEVESGADFIITQMAFEAETFIHFIEECRKSGIDAPIIPGILPIQSYGCIKQLSKLSKVKIPSKIMNVIKPIRDNDEAVLKYGTYLTVELCKALLEAAVVCGLHFFTLNRETATTEILKRVGLWKHEEILRRKLPWQQCDNEERALEENVRPIFWALRPNSYVQRTSQWEEFPNGRWGDSSSSSFGLFKDYHLFFTKNRDRLPKFKQMWRESLECVEDVFDVFACFISGNPNKDGFKVTNIPWTEEDDLAPETSVIRDHLVYLNQNGILTINSQPNVNCVPSTDKVFGWGSPGGYIFQKAYLEFFVNEEDVLNLIKVLQDYPLVNYHMINKSGTANHTNGDQESSNAVTWGVFSGRAILQPTVVDPVAFESWKDEAFELWIQQWGKLYSEKSHSRHIIQEIHDKFYLVNLVDNDYVKGNCLFEIVDKIISMRNEDSFDRSKASETVS